MIFVCRIICWKSHKPFKIINKTPFSVTCLVWGRDWLNEATEKREYHIERNENIEDKLYLEGINVYINGFVYMISPLNTYKIKSNGLSIKYLNDTQTLVIGTSK
jgi:hypothetical protein